MNKFLLILLTCFVFACNIRDTKSKETSSAPLNTETKVFTDSTTVQAIDTVYNFGKITDGESVTYNFRFKNTGNKPLIIADAVASCGCTVPEKPTEPIKPGETGFLKVVFNSQGRVGEAHKQITVTSNAFPAFPVLELRGEVLAVKK